MSVPNAERRPGGGGVLEQMVSASTVSETTDTDMVAIALSLAARGLHVFPVQHRGKKPADGVKWGSEATTDPHVIVSWFAGTSHNIGVSSGPSGLLIVDEDAPGEFARYAASIGETVPATFKVATGKGTHYYLARPADLVLGNSPGALKGYKVDIRGKGGYVVGPGSLHTTGVRYTAPDLDAPIAPMPAWLIEALTPPPRRTKTPILPPIEVPLHPYAAAAVAGELQRLDECARLGWNGAAWDSTTYAVACNLIEVSNSPWSGYSISQARADLLAHAPRDSGFTSAVHDAKWRSALAKVDGQGRTAPLPNRQIQATDGTDDATAAVAPKPTPSSDDRESLTDAHLAAQVAREVLGNRYCWARALGWMGWDGRRWHSVSEAQVVEAVRLYFIELLTSQAATGAQVQRLRGLSGLLSRHRIVAVVGLARGVTLVDGAAFDQEPDLLNVGNGVVDLRTGRLQAHDPALLLTKVTTVDYDPGAVSPDWRAALESLPDDVFNWWQIRIGQAATGHTPSDDVMPVCQGGGSNGKTLQTGAIMRALGEHAVLISDRVLLASPDAHPTELMDLRGARLALIEETPEARRLSVARLKKVLGTPLITARHMRRNDVTFTASHSLVLTTNYRLQIAETDHGTWRRLALLRFPYTFRGTDEPLRCDTDRRGDPGLRSRLMTSQAAQRAVLRWIVDGAVGWYAAGRLMPTTPARVIADTRSWRADADHVLGYLMEHLVLDRDHHVMTTDMHADFNAYLESRGLCPWNDQTLAERFGGHSDVVAAGVEKRRVANGAGLSRPPRGLALVGATPARAMSWVGVRFRTESDDAQASIQVKPAAARHGGRGGRGDQVP